MPSEVRLAGAAQDSLRREIRQPEDLSAFRDARAEQPGLSGGAGGQDGQDIEHGVAGYLDYLSQLCRQLGVPDPVEEYFSPVIGRWSAMHEEATLWREGGRAADEIAKSVTKPLGALDSAWQGADADSFMDYMQRVGLAGNDMSDAMNSMAEVLDRTADGIREIVLQMADVLAEAAEATSRAMAMPVRGEDRARQYLAEIQPLAKEFFESVRQVIEAFVQLCDGVDGAKAFDQIKMAHTFPEENWSLSVDMPQAPDVPTVSEALPASTGSVAASGASGFTGGGGGAGSIGGVGGAGVSAGSSAPQQPATPGGYTLAGEQPAAKPQAPAAAAGAGAGAQRGGAMGGGMPMMPMGMGMGGGAGGDQEHKSRSRVIGDPEDIFGKPTKSSPPVIGEDEG